LNTKNLGNFTSFLTITHTTMSTKQFRKYGILTIDVAIVFCFWIELRQKGSSISRLVLAESQEVLNTILEGNSPLSDGLINGSKQLVINKLR
jgi:hypothetical protein